MIADLKPYPEYKESGLPWLWQVPGHWNVRRMKSAVTNVIEQTFEMHADEAYVALEHIESWTGKARPQSDTSLFTGQVKRFREGDVLFGKLRPYLAKVARMRTNGVCAGEFFVLRPTDLTASGAYLEHHLRAKPIIDVINASTFGAKMPRADWQFCGDLPVPLPPPAEQAAIVRFLDWANGRLERAIRAKRKVIALLNEQKQAIIHRAVTRGLDPSAPLKPSGIPWLGEIPRHWEVRKLRTLVHHIDQGVSPLAVGFLAEGDSWGVLKSGCVNRGVFRETEHKQLARSFQIDPAIVVKVGDVLISRACGSPSLVGSVGRVRSLRYQLILSDKTFRAVFRDVVDVDFMVFAMNCRYYRHQVEQAISGAEGMANNLPLSSLRDFRFAIPPAREATAIAGHLEGETTGLQIAIARLEREINLLREYRTRLVADVVTGKLDVRDAAARLPEETEEPEALDEPESMSEAEDETADDLDTATAAAGA